ncbi:hypothetical protein B0J11DRAFT_513619 [Dendryphion nanum]|uniref:Uncharacterized protein n=1 Tax=Dendryphion nanum TaxID=256645 RepID=A0A9P9EH30_9PLEO|nr:hypothetical protein B0J11DRAFT_513619 [Dendryphion nanum]
MTTHILSRKSYTTHHLVSLPPPTLDPLPPSSLRIRSKILSLTTNNLTYALVGHLTGWWDVYPPPPTTPAPFNNTTEYGRIAAWGYAEILESTVDDIPAGASIYGYLPISTLPEDIQVVQPFKNQIVVTDPHRAHLWPLYNRYTIYPSLSLKSEIEEIQASMPNDSLGWDALLQPLFNTSYNLNRYAFAWTPERLVHPSNAGPWNAEDANLTDATVIFLSASGKTALTFAQQLRQARPKEHQPRDIIGVGSAASRKLSESSGFYDRVVLYDENEAVKDSLDKKSSTRVLIFDFGAREGGRSTWNATFAPLESSESSKGYTFFSVGGEVKARSPEEIAAQRQKPTIKFVQVNATELREKGIELEGDAYFRNYSTEYEKFQVGGWVPGMRLQWGEGLEAWERGWEAFCKDEVSAASGLVYRL